MKRFFWLLLAVLLSQSASFAQTSVAETGAAKIIQPSQTSTATTPIPAQRTGPELKIPAGTPIEVEVAYTVSSLDIKPGELLSFRVLIPVIIDGVTAIEKGALVTARVTLSKRGGHWGKAGRLAWAMEDVVAADNTRILLDPATHSRNEALWNLESKGKDSKTGNSAGPGQRERDEPQGRGGNEDDHRCRHFPATGAPGPDAWVQARRECGAAGGQTFCSCRAE